MSDENGVPPPADPQPPASGQRPPPGTVLNGQQRALLQALEARDPRLATMYSGGLIVVRDANNPNRHALFAHSMRELMGKLPAYADVAMPAHRESMGAKVREVEDVHTRMRERTACELKEGAWTGSIDAHVSAFLVKFGSFVDWLNQHQPRRRAEIDTALAKLEVASRRLPRKLADLNIDVWNEMRDFFVAVAHHRHDSSDEECLEWLDAFERFLLDKLAPRTFEDFGEIDKILAAGQR